MEPKYLDRKIYDYAESLGYDIDPATFNLNEGDGVYSEFKAKNGLIVVIERHPRSPGYERGYWEASILDKNRDYFKRDGMDSLMISDKLIKWFLADAARGGFTFQRSRKHWFLPETDYIAKALEEEPKLVDDFFDDFDEFDAIEV